MSDAGHNGPDRDTYLKHQASAIIYAEKREQLNAEISRSRKQAKAAGIELADLDWTVKVMSWTTGEIAAFFRRRLAYLGFNNITVKGAETLIGDHTEDQTYAGTLAGMQGRVCSPPANLTPNEKQTWITGWHEGNKARDAATFDIKEADDKAAAARASAVPMPDADTAAAQELGGDGYGDEDSAPTAEEFTAQAVQSVMEPDKPPHQPKKTRVKKTPDPVH